MDIGLSPQWIALDVGEDVLSPNSKKAKPNKSETMTFIIFQAPAFPHLWASSYLVSSSSAVKLLWSMM